MKILLRIILLSGLLLNAAQVFSQGTDKNESYKYMHMLSADEMYQKIDYDFQATAAPVGPVRAIAEWETMSAVLIRYPFGIPIAFIKVLAEKDTVITLVYNNSEESSVRQQYQNAGVNMSRVKFFYANTDSYWTRDYGPWFIINGENKVSVLNFNYNRPRENDNKVPQYIDDYLGMPYYAMNVVHTGGNFMTDGYGSAASTTIVYTESDDLGITNAMVDERMLSYMGIDNHIVLNDPNNTYIDHIDCWGKFLDVDKILIRKVPASHPQYSQIEAMASYWANKTSKWGNKYQVYRVNTPDDQPYTNSLILNRRVFVPIKGSSYDNAALDVYRQAMPGYEIIGVLNNTYDTPWESTDALHCRTHEIADKNMVNLIHFPLLGQQPDTSSYSIVANIDALSGAGLNADSVLLHYRYAENEWQTATMSNISGNTYGAAIQNPTSGTSVSYYISATDNIGKAVQHPYIGKSDPHTFITGNTQNSLENISISQTEVTFEEGDEYPVLITITNNGEEPAQFVESNISSLTYFIVETVGNEEFPITLNGGSSFQLSISPNTLCCDRAYATNTENTNTEMLELSTSENIYRIKLTADKSFLSSLNSSVADNIRAYPNPFTGRIKVDVAGIAGATARIYNANGVMVARLTASGDGCITWDAAQAPKGLYLISIETAGSQRIKSIRVVKE